MIDLNDKNPEDLDFLMQQMEPQFKAMFSALEELFKVLDKPKEKDPHFWDKQ